MNGLAVLADRETRSHWDHITGEAISGPLKESQLEVWPVRMTTVAAALIECSDVSVFLSGYRSYRWRLAQRLYPRFVHNKGWLPGFFYASMNEPIDPRLDKLDQGLGVVVGKRAKYYPMNRISKDGIQDCWLDRKLCVERGAIDGIPHAKWLDKSEEPMQILSRWYGFSFTFPRCEIYEPS